MRDGVVVGPSKQIMNGYQAWQNQEKKLEVENWHGVKIPEFFLEGNVEFEG